MLRVLALRLRCWSLEESCIIANVAAPVCKSKTRALYGSQSASRRVGPRASETEWAHRRRRTRNCRERSRRSTRRRECNRALAVAMRVCFVLCLTRRRCGQTEWLLHVGSQSCSLPGLILCPIDESRGVADAICSVHLLEGRMVVFSMRQSRLGRAVWRCIRLVV